MIGNIKTKPRILIAGVGNIFLGDDAFGSEVAQQLARRSWPESVRVVDFGIRGIDLTFALLENPDLTILIDTTSRGGAPGTVYTIEPDLTQFDDLGPEASMVETHDMNPLRVLACVKSMGGELKRILLIGCEPLFLGTEQDGYLGMSEPVRAAVDASVRLVESLVETYLHEPRKAVAG